MIALFISEGCSGCANVIKDIPDSWASQIKVLHVKFDVKAKHYRVYDNGKALKGRAPISTVPTLCFFETSKIYAGYSEIMERLTDGNR